MSKRVDSSSSKNRIVINQYKNSKLRRGGAKEIVINPDLIYAEREIWSPQYAQWKRYRVHMPRLPDENDSNHQWIDLTANTPRTFSIYTGNHNQEYFNHLTNYAEIFDQTKNLPDALVITGPGGSGKSSSIRVLVERFFETLNLATHQQNRWCLYLDATKFLSDFTILWNRIDKFAETSIERFISAKFRLLIIDNYEIIFLQLINFPVNPSKQI